MSTPIELTLEQQANLRIFEMRCKGLSQPQVVNVAVNTYRQMLIKETYYKSFLVNSLGLQPPRLEKLP
jgi:Phycobilisome degradation protein nblA